MNCGHPESFVPYHVKMLIWPTLSTEMISICPLSVISATVGDGGKSPPMLANCGHPGSFWPV